MNLSDNPVLWKRTPDEIAGEITSNSQLKNAIIGAIKQERQAARPYVQSCTDARWADDPATQQRVHCVTLNGVDVTAVCVGFNTTEGWVELLITAGSHQDGRPKMVFGRSIVSPQPLTVRVAGDVQVTMTGALNQVVPDAAHEVTR